MKFITVIMVAFALVGCGGNADQVSYADTVYRNGNIWTGVEEAPRAEAMAVAGETISYVGAEGGLADIIGPGTKIVDLEGAFVVPGFIDNHTHFLFGGFGLASVQLRDASTPEEFARRIGEFAAGKDQGAWILNGDWDHEIWGGALPRADWIDAVTPDNPVFVMRLDGHMGLANSKAMTLAGVTADTPTPRGGEIVRDGDGAPTGVFKDTAMKLIEAAIPPSTEEEYDAAFKAAANRALSRGVTQIHDMGLIEAEWTAVETYQRQKQNGVLPLRIYVFAALPEWERLAAHIEENGHGDDWLRWGGVKGFVDGSLGSTTAWFYEPYDDAPETSGFPLGDLDDVQANIIAADAAGLHVAVHAIGDRANDWLLDSFEKTVQENGGAIRDRRFRIEHAQHLSKTAIARFGELGVIPSAQPYHAIDDGRWAEKRIGPERIKRTYAFRSLLDAGAPLTFGSDWTVAPIDPLAGIYAAVTRRTTDGANPDGWVPAQRITVEEALRAYTAGNAYAGFQEDRLGTIEPGKLADFVVLSGDITAIDSAEIINVKVLRTVIGGEEKYSAQ